MVSDNDYETEDGSNSSNTQGYDFVPDNEMQYVDSQRFNCDDPRLITSVESRVGKIQNIMTVAENRDIKTCDCEAFAPNLPYVGTTEVYIGQTQETRYKRVTKYGVRMVYKAQPKDNGEIVWNGRAANQ